MQKRLIMTETIRAAAEDRNVLMPENKNINRKSGRLATQTKSFSILRMQACKCT